MSLPKFKFYSLKEDYTTDKNAGSIADRDIIFIEDTREIISHNVVISGDLSEDDVNTLLANYATISNGTIPTSELPIATDSSVGVVSINPSSSLSVDSSGMLSDAPLISLSDGGTVIFNYDESGVPTATSYSKNVYLLVDGVEAGSDNEKYVLSTAAIVVGDTEYDSNHNIHPFISTTVDSDNNYITVAINYTVSDDNKTAYDAIIENGGFKILGYYNNSVSASASFVVPDLSLFANPETPTGDTILLNTYSTATGTTEEELTPAATDTVSVALGKLFKAIQDNEEVTSTALFKIKDSVGLDEDGGVTFEDTTLGNTIVEAINELKTESTTSQTNISDLTSTAIEDIVITDLSSLQDTLDTLVQTTDGTYKHSNVFKIYRIMLNNPSSHDTYGDYNLGILITTGDSMGHGTDQLFITKLELDSDGALDMTHTDGALYGYRRYYNATQDNSVEIYDDKSKYDEVTGNCDEVSKGTFSKWYDSFGTNIARSIKNNEYHINNMTVGDFTYSSSGMTANISVDGFYTVVFVTSSNVIYNADIIITDGVMYILKGSGGIGTAALTYSDGVLTLSSDHTACASNNILSKYYKFK